MKNPPLFFEEDYLIGRIVRTGGASLTLTSIAILDVTRVTKILHKLSSAGIQIVLDDFGTGYSSLKYLNDFQIQKLKIDQSFVQSVGNHQSSAIVETIINMARALNLKVIAEGVETKEQLDYLQSLGCDEVQGYLLGKPMPADVFAEKMRYRYQIH